MEHNTLFVNTVKDFNLYSPISVWCFFFALDVICLSWPTLSWPSYFIQSEVGKLLFRNGSIPEIVCFRVNYLF